VGDMPAHSQKVTENQGRYATLRRFGAPESGSADLKYQGSYSKGSASRIVVISELWLSQQRDHHLRLSQHGGNPQADQSRGD
jgi:hypothetical protein